MWWTKSLCTPANEDRGTLAEYDPLTGYERNDNHISEATEPYIQESSVENGSPNDLEYDDVTIGKALSPPMFTQEREDDASRRRACHSQDEGLSSSQPPSVVHYRTVGQVVKPFDSQIPSVREIIATAQKVSKSGFFWSDKESRFSLTVKQRFENTSSRLVLTEEVFRSCMKRSSRRKKNFIVLRQKNDVDNIINLFMNRY